MSSKKLNLILISFVFLFAIGITASANTSQAIEDYLLTESYYRQHLNDEKAPLSMSDAGQESVDLSSGSVSYSATDLSLPGKGGFDLDIVRRSSSDLYLEPGGKTKLVALLDAITIYTTHSSDKYVFPYHVNGDTSTQPVYIAYDSETEMIQAEVDGGIYTSPDYTLYAVNEWIGYNNTGSSVIYTLGSDSGCTAMGLKSHDTFYNYAAIPKTGSIHLVRDKNFGSGIISFSNKVASERQISQQMTKGLPVCSGWYIDIPQVNKTYIAIYNEDDPLKSQYTTEIGRFFDPETGITVCYESLYKDWKYSGYDEDETELQFSTTDVVCYNEYGEIEDYSDMYTITIKDSILKSYDNNYNAYDPVTIKNEFDYRMVVERYDGVKFYFRQMRSNEEMYLVKKEDRFENSIYYYYEKYHDDYGNMVGMIDSCDRNIYIPYTSFIRGLKGIYVNEIPAVKYEFQRVNNAQADPNNLIDLDNSHQLKVIKNNDTNNPNYVIYSSLYDNQPYITSDSTKNSNNKNTGLYSTIEHPTFIMKSVETSAGGRIEYSYERKTDPIPDTAFSTKSYNRVTKRVEREADGTVADVTQYSYNHSNVENKISTMTKGDTGYSVTEKYNEDNELTERTTISENGQTKEEYTYIKTPERKPLVSKVVQTQYNKNGSNGKSVTTEYTYNSYHQPTRETNGLNTTTYTYGTYGQLTGSTTLQSSNLIIGVENTLSSDKKTVASTKTYTKPANSNTITYKDLQSYTYNQHGDVTGVVTKRYVNGTSLVTENSTTSTYTYQTLTNAHTGPALVVTQSSSGENITDSDGTNPGSKTLTVTTEYDIFGNVIKVTDAKGGVTTTEYDTMRRPVKVTNPDGTTNTVEYDDENNTIVQTDENGNSIKVVYDSLGRQWQTYAKKDGTWKKVSENKYDGFGRLEYTALFANGTEKGRSEYTYYNDDSIKTETVKEGSTILSSKTFLYEPGYSATEARTGAIVNTGLECDTTVYTYTDKWGRQTKEQATSYRNGAVETYTSTFTTDIAGNILTSTDYNGNVTTYEYDYKNRAVKTTAPNGTYTETTYDTYDNPLTVRDYKGNVTTMTYNTLGQLITTVVPVQSGVTSTNKQYYDLSGNVTRVEQQNNKPGEAASYSVVRNVYDSRNRLVSSIGNDGAEDKITAYEYDNVGNVIKMTTGLATGETPDPSKHSITTFSYDSMNNPVSTTDALGKTSTAQYDLLGNMVQTADRNGKSVSYTYDALGRVKTVTAEDTTVAYEYNLLGQISKMIDSTGVTNYEYDGLGLLTKETKGNIIKTYDYDNNGNRTAFTLTENGEVTLNITYAYDNLNRLVSVTANGETTSYSYDANGNLISESTGGKSSTIYSYNNANQLTALTNTAAGQTVASYSVSYYLDGNKSAIAESGQPTISYVYDGIGQLVSETAEGVSQTSYTYDGRQNRIGKTTNNLSDNTVQSISTYTYDLNNRLIKEIETAGEAESTTDYYYDHNGNQITKLRSVIAPDTLEAESIGLSDIHPMAEFYTYDGLNRLSSATVNGKVTSYTYDGNNLRQTKTTDGVVTSHIYDGMNVVSDTVGATRNLYVRGIALISGSFNGTKTYYHRNTHGDIIALTDGNGTISTDYRYDAFGNQLASCENDTNPFRYCGEYFDSETNNIYLRNRYYDTVTGRFITEDPIKDGLNWYVYCSNNPIMFIDPTGYLDTGYDQNGVWHDWDAEKFGENSVKYKMLVGLTTAYNNAYSDKDRTRIAEIANTLRVTDTAITDSIFLNNSEGASGFGHTGVMLLNSYNQGFLFSYWHHENNDTSPLFNKPAEMRFSILSSGAVNELKDGWGSIGDEAVTIHGNRRGESYDRFVWNDLTQEQGEQMFSKAISIFTNPGDYNLISLKPWQCDVVVHEIFSAAGIEYERATIPNNTYSNFKGTTRIGWSNELGKSREK